MQRTKLHGWVEYTSSLWQQGHPLQHLSFTRFSDDGLSTLIVKVEQSAPNEPAVLSAVKTRRGTVGDVPVTVEEAMSEQELVELKEMYLAMPGTPPNTRFEELATC